MGGSGGTNVESPGAGCSVSVNFAMAASTTDGYESVQCRMIDPALGRLTITLRNDIGPRSPRLRHQISRDAFADVALDIHRRSVCSASKGDGHRVGGVG
jgi:hypothetical protein